ncbi:MULTISPECIES: SflA family class IV lanthipeptide [unclassified Streptomyces]|uniref:SflA family class IV lanthipeptide n=1 Tax=Streptomycetaceae TaxID=2062 RepID=UPI002E79F070|nr:MULTISPECIES: SflA family class IV lanthipeptide [unclassified Streptomyces]MED7950317.1 SflA family class IV lanthipeptide [Streptomyces sp. BE303]MEE1828558.1 SflA family class IV lanthipeptide [Streptomyces sp. BE20]
MSALALDIRDAGLLDIDDETITFEDEFDADLAPVACLADPWVTYVPTRFECAVNS